jgi:hypothetical protein
MKPKVDRQIPLAASTINIALDVEVLVLVPAGVLATLTINTPVYPKHGQELIIVSTQAVTALTMGATSPQTVIGAATALVANIPVRWVYFAPASTWYPV